MPALPSLGLNALRSAYAEGTLTPSALVEGLYPSLEGSHAVFILLLPLDQLLQRATELEAQPADSRGPLWGVPFAVKDNVDVRGLPTTAACAAFKYVPQRSAPAVQALLDAGCIMVGKTNMDQFASGLVGTRSPYGVARNAFDARFIPGGSSSGSGAAVGGGLVSFALGTDTAGSGRVPAGYNGCVGIKPTVGSISSVGVVPACAALDCLSVFARSVEVGAAVARVMRSAVAGAADVWRRSPAPTCPPPPALTASPAGDAAAAPALSFRFGVPAQRHLEWGGSVGNAAAAAAAAQFQDAVQRMVACGGQLVEIDFDPFAVTAALLYQSSFVAERYSGIRTFLDKGNSSSSSSGGGSGGGGSSIAPHGAAEAALAQQRALKGDERLLPVTRAIISGAGIFTAADVYDDNARLAKLRAAARQQLARVDCLLVPTALEHYLVSEVQGEEDAPEPAWTRNAKNGRFTNFVNLLDMCGCSVPSGVLRVDYAGEGGKGGEGAARAEALRAAGGPLAVALPFGVTLLAHAWHDEWLWGLAAAMHAASGLGCGPEGHGVQPMAAV